MKEVVLNGELGFCCIYKPQDKSKMDPEYADGPPQYPSVLKIEKNTEEVNNIMNKVKKVVKESPRLESKEAKKEALRLFIKYKFKDGDKTDKEHLNGYYLLQMNASSPPATGKIIDGTIHKETYTTGSVGWIGSSDVVKVIVDIYVAKNNRVQIKLHCIYLVEKGDYSLMPSDASTRHEVGAKVLGLEVYENPETAVDQDAVNEFKEATGKKAKKVEAKVEDDMFDEDNEDVKEFREKTKTKPKKVKKEVKEEVKKEEEAKEDDLWDLDS